MEKSNYKGYTLEIYSETGSCHIYKDGVLKGSTHSDTGKVNQLQKAKKRIDDGMPSIEERTNKINTKK